MPPSSCKKKVQAGTQLLLRFIANFVSGENMWFSFYKSSDSTAWQLEDDLHISWECTGHETESLLPGGLKCHLIKSASGRLGSWSSTPSKAINNAKLQNLKQSIT